MINKLEISSNKKKPRTKRKEGSCGGTGKKRTNFVVILHWHLFCEETSTDALFKEFDTTSDFRDLKKKSEAY